MNVLFRVLAGTGACTLNSTLVNGGPAVWNCLSAFHCRQRPGQGTPYKQVQWVTSPSCRTHPWVVHESPCSTLGRGHWWWSIPLWCSHCARLAPLCPVIWHGCRANGSWPRKMSLHPFVTAPPGFILQKIKVPCVCKKAGTDACCAPGIVSWAHSQLCLDIEQARVLSFYSPHIDFENNCVHEISSAITIWKFGEVSTALCFPAAIPATHALSQKCSELIYVLNVIMIGDQVLPGGEKEHKKYKGNKIK